VGYNVLSAVWYFGVLAI